VLAGLAAVGAVLAAIMIEPQPKEPQVEVVEEALQLEAA
jgi:hypothetical protein